MTASPSEGTRERIVGAVGFSVLLPGLAHWLAGDRRGAATWFVLCQALLFGGFVLAGGTQKEFGIPIGFGGMQLLFVMLPELGNFLGSQVAAAMFESLDFEGRYPANLPLRGVGYLMSGMSGVLACFCAAHAAGGLVYSRELPDGPRHLHPGRAAVATLLLPGLGHWLSGRKFKAYLLGGSILGLFLLGMALGDFADFQRPRHPYYWVGQMFLGAPGWLVALLCDGAKFDAVLPYMDAGLLFTTSAGFFTIIAALDAYQRAEQDLLALRPGQPAADGDGTPANAPAVPAATPLGAVPPADPTPASEGQA